jgi:hypothetical protein
MKLFLAHIGPFPHFGGAWGFIILFLLILFVALVAADASKSKDK